MSDIMHKETIANYGLKKVRAERGQDISYRTRKVEGSSYM